MCVGFYQKYRVHLCVLLDLQSCVSDDLTLDIWNWGKRRSGERKRLFSVLMIQKSFPFFIDLDLVY